jgi:hypothetical protein
MDSRDFASIGIEAREIDSAAVRDISAEVLGQDGRVKVLPASYWQTTTREERALFGHQHAVYSFPTTELVERLTQIIDGRSAIEIGAGNGVLAQALGIPATDSRQQDMPKYRAFYLLSGQPTIAYGPNVEQMHASRAVRHYKPKVVIGCWVTHKWEATRQHAQGTEDGVDEADVMAHCDTFVLVGNEHVHRYARMLERHPAIEYPDWLYSRATNDSRNMIAVWNRRR